MFTGVAIRYARCCLRANLRIAETAAGRHVIYSLDYTLAPERRFPAQLDELVAALEYLIATFNRPIILLGDSAGAALALSILLSHPRLAGHVDAAVLISPWVDAKPVPMSYAENRKTDFVEVDQLIGHMDRYLPVGAVTVQRPLVSPTHADLRLLAGTPIFVH